MFGRMIFSSVFAVEKSSAIGQYEEGSERSFRFGDGDGFGGYPYLRYSVCIDCDVEKVG